MSDLPDDETIRVRRSWPGDPPAPAVDDILIDEVTEVSRRRGAASARTVLPLPDVPTERVDAERARRRRATFIDSVDGAEQIEDATDGSTIVAHRESRRRAARAQDDAEQAPAQDPREDDTGAPLVGRAAHAPDAPAVVYGVRDANPVMASRAPAEQTPAQVPFDGDAADARRRRASRRAVMIVVASTSAVVATAAVALVAVLIAP